jgi:hypothetical protein
MSGGGGMSRGDQSSRRRRGLWRNGRCWCDGRSGRAHASGPGSCFTGRLCGGFRSFGSRFGVRRSLEVQANLFRDIEIKRARMGFFVGNAKFREVIEDGLRLDLELPGELIDSNLIGVRHSFLCS